MNHGGFTLLWSKTLGSSIWLEPSATRIVWFTLMMLKDQNGFVRGGSINALAHIARVTPKECATALETFLAPDKDSSSQNEDGRRIRKVQGGWQLINHEEYRYSTEARREFWRQQKAEQRTRQEQKKKRIKKGRPLNGEEETLRKLEAGEITQEQADDRAARSREKRA
jgi:hypothetical protein